ncbi:MULTISPECIES: YHS domain-containing (seleno)protein [unclassified Bradyrhizobium]|uniref:YHS domain-containing (seleno)protein n=1 Tax=unclassified Bradyrhizobium TaxID=2631580 RepID=UPI0029160A90|nr:MULTISPECIES: YHS domain-containing (seleno)protein [unclassified Bradyrhizobium]
MTGQRQQRNLGGATSRFCLGIVAILFLAAASAAVAGARAATTERVITNRFSGLAIDGYDPVAYFVNGKPMQGLQEFEAWQGGVVWRFHNEGNRASFLAHPEIYGPQFGGYDPTDVARGVTVAGNPRLWLVADQRLFLFSREDNRDSFAADPDRYLRQAAERWPALMQDLPE